MTHAGRGPATGWGVVMQVMGGALAVEVDSEGDSMVAFLANRWGPLQPLLDEPDVEEVWWSDPARVFCARGGRAELTSVALTEAEAREIVLRAVMAAGRRLDTSQPFVDAQLPDRTRLHAVIPGITERHWAVNLRRYVSRATRLAELVAGGSLTEQAAGFLVDAIASRQGREGANVLVAGGTQCGKTTFLNALLGEIGSHERIVSCEDTRELRLPHPDWTAMQTRSAGIEGAGEVTMRDLVREALRMRPTRLVVGEVRGAEALDLLLAMNCGLPCASTLHASSPRETVTKLAGLPLLAGPNIAERFVTQTLWSCVDLIVFLRMDSNGRRVVQSITSVTAGEDTPLLGQIFTRIDGRLVRGAGHWEPR